MDNFRERMRAEHPQADTFHILNESLLQDLLRGAPQALVYRRVVAQIVLAAEAGADRDRRHLLLHLPGGRYRAAGWCRSPC